jgi:hypothetical protein
MFPDITDNYSLNNAANDLSELAILHNQLLTTGKLIITGTGGDTAPLPTYSTVRRPWLDAPEGAVPFDPQTAVALGAVGTIVTVVSLTVPDGYDGVINAYSWNFTGAGFVEGSGDLIAQVLRNTAAVRNYDNILVEKGTIAQPRPISPLRVYSGQIISLTVNHVANPLLVGNLVASFVGYFYPSAS